MVRKKQKHDEWFLDAARSSGVTLDGISLKSLANSLSEVLATVKDNAKTLADLTTSRKGLEDRISKLVTVTQNSVREVAILKPQMDRVRNRNQWRYDGLAPYMRSDLDVKISLPKSKSDLEKADWTSLDKRHYYAEEIDLWYGRMVSPLEETCVKVANAKKKKNVPRKPWMTKDLVNS
ncbi:hypothetical protein QYM36_018435, partial [Artemia franciscana]